MAVTNSAPGQKPIVEFDASVSGAHVVPYQSKQLKGLIATIDHVSSLTPGNSPTVTFKITNGDNTAVDGTTLARVGPIIGRPTFSYSNPGITGTVCGQPLRDNAAHAYINTAPFGEACASCHSGGMDYGVDKVHAR
jgi:hypothetical protein